jgi:hypothetical protein
MPYGEGGMPYDASGMGRPGSLVRTEDVVEYQLFRFFDFDVEPGKRYQYRVRLGLFNPNHQVKPRFLAKEDLGKQWWIQTDWSEASNVVKVPRDSRLLAGTVKPASSVLHEPSARVIAVTLRMEDGLETSEEYTVFRGHLANFEGKIVQERAGAYGMGGMPGGYEELMGAPMYAGAVDEDEGPRGPPRRTTADEDEEAETINHATGLVVLDMVGGGRLHRSDRSLTEPASLLLLDPDGNLLVQDELGDAEEFAVFHVPEEPKQPRRKRRRPGEGMYPGMPDEMGDMYDEMMGGAGMYGEGPTPRRGRGRRSRTRYDEE